MSTHPAPDMSIPTGGSIVDFWRWAFSSLADNTLRGIFAEYLVGQALGVVSDSRVEWDAFDLHYDGAGIEVKSSAEQQTWAQEKPSVIRFDIAKKRFWNSATNEVTATPDRPADIYVFCHYAGAATNEAVVDPANWVFYVLATAVLNDELGDQKSVGLSTLAGLAAPVPWSELRAKVDSALG